MRKKKKKKSKPQSYKIKIPVYTTEVISKSNDLFGTSYDDMISVIKNKINKFSTRAFENRNSTKKTVINHIECIDHQLGDRPCLLLRISAYTTNLLDGYFKEANINEPIGFKKDSEIGSNHNFIMLYPIILGMDSDNYTQYFIVLVYEDPNKDSGEVIRLSKIVLRRIVGIPIRNIKLSTILEELKDLSTIPELQIKYFSISTSENEVDVKYQPYLFKGNLKRVKEQEFKNMPFDIAQDLLNSNEDTGFERKVTKMTIGKKEYKISKEEIANASEEMKETAEKIFNATATIQQDELDSIYKNDFIIDKLTGVLNEYLKNDNGPC